MEKHSQEISKEMAETKEDDLNIVMDSSSSENNFILERYLSDSTSAEKLTYPNTTMDSTSKTYKRKEDLEGEMPRKRQKDNAEINLSEGLKQVSTIEENQSMNTIKECLPEVCYMTYNVKQINHSGESETTNVNPYVFNGMSSENNPFTSETIYLSNAILCFEKANSSSRDKPLGCKTIFVNGFPQKITVKIIKEIFQRCGSIAAIKMAGNDSCYVVFSEEISVEFAMQFSGYRLTIDNKKEAPYSGILLINYTPVEFNHSSNVTPTHCDSYFSESEMKTLFQKLETDDTFMEVLCKLKALFCNTQPSKAKNNSLFPLLRKVYCFVLLLLNKKEQFEMNSTKSKADLIKHLKETCKTLNEIHNLYKLLQEENNWIYFSPKQKKDINLYERYCNDYKTLYLEELVFLQNSSNEEENESNNEFCRENEIPVSLANNSELQNEKDKPCLTMIDFLSHHTKDSARYICERLNNEETFIQAANTIITWLEQEECSADNAKSFMSMLHCVKDHVLKLCHSKSEYEKNFHDAKQILIRYLKEILCCLITIEQVYSSVSLEQCLNHFTLVDRYNIQQWEKSAKQLKLDVIKKIRELRKKENQDNKKAGFVGEMNSKIQKLKDEQASLKQQVQEVNNAIARMKCNMKKDFERLNKQVAVIQKAVRKSQIRNFQLNERCLATEVEIRQLRTNINQQNVENGLPAGAPPLSQEQARLISLICIFLSIHPGGSIDSIHSYIHGIDATINLRIIENLMRSLPTVFQEEISVIGINFQRKWYFI